MGSCRHRVPALNAAASASDERNFSRFYNQEFCSKELEVPEEFVSRFLGRAPEIFRLESAQGTWRVGARNDGQSMFFSAGWPAFVRGNNLLTGDFLTFHYEGGSSFEVGIYGLHACRKDADMTRTSGSRASIWASSFKSLATRQEGVAGGVSPVKFPKEELQNFSEEEGSGGNGGASRRRGRRLSSSEDDISSDGTRGGRRRFGRSVIPPYKRGRRLSSSGEDDSSDDGSRRSRSPPVHLSSGREGLYTGTLRSNKATAQFPPQPRARIRDNDDVISARLHSKERFRSRLKEEGQGGYDGRAQRRGRASLSSSEDDSSNDDSRGWARRMPRRRSPPRRPSSGGDGPKTGTLRSNKATTKFPPHHRAKNRSGGGGMSARSRLKMDLGGSAQRMRRSSLPSSEDSSDDGGRGGGRRFQRIRTPSPSLSSGSRYGPKSGTLRSNRATTKFPPQPRAEYRGNGGEVSARMHPKEELRRNLEEEAEGGSSGAPRWSERTLSEDGGSDSGSSDSGSRDGGRRRTPPRRRLSSGGSKSNGVTTKFPPELRTKSRGSGSGMSARLHPREELQDSSEEDSSDGGGAQQRVSISSSEDDISDDGSRGGGRRTGRTRSPPPRFRSGRDEPKTGVLRPHMAATKFAPQSQARNHGSGGGPSARLRPKEELQGNSEEERRGGYGGVARPMGRAPRSDFKDDISDDGSRGGGGGRIPRSRTMPYSHENGRDGRNAGKSEGGVIFLEDD